MSKKYAGFLFIAFLSLFFISNSSCNRKTGCPVNERAHVKPNKKGQLPTKGGKSNLFPKNMRKGKN